MRGMMGIGSKCRGWWLPLAFLAVSGQPASAEVLTLFELEQMTRFVVDQACGSVDPCPAPEWNKDGSAAGEVLQLDLELATLQFWNESYICYQNEAEEPDHLGVSWCDIPAAYGVCSEDACDDRDGDGIERWREDEIGTSDAAADGYNAVCDETADDPGPSHIDCGFDEACEINPLLAEYRCLPLDCAASGTVCTAFHLEQVTSNNQELIARVHFDQSPRDVTVLDLRVEYDDQVLGLIDARLLRQEDCDSASPGAHCGKELAVSHPRAGSIRLVVYSMNASPIAVGELAELEFQRVSAASTTLAFSTDDDHQTHSMAPDQDGAGDGAQEDLAVDARWGDAISLDQADPNGHRLLLHYRFDQANKPLDHTDASVPSAEELCALYPACDLEGDPIRKNRLLGELEALQQGVAKGSQSIEGVYGGGILLDGVNDHLEFPVTLNQPYEPEAQSFSLGGWVYAEGFAEEEPIGTKQIIFSQNNYDENTEFGLMFEKTEDAGGDVSVGLVWFQDSYETSDIRTTVVTDFPVLEWAHLGLSVDVQNKVARVYVDGEEVAPGGISEFGPTSVAKCPQFGSGGDGTVELHRQGDVVGGEPPGVVYYASPVNNLLGIVRMDENGLGAEDVIRSGDRSYQDPHYSPILDKVL